MNIKNQLVIVTEGPTSCAAGLALGYFCIGLPSAGAGVDHLNDVVRWLDIKRVIVLADNKVRDDGTPDMGIAAAERVSNQLRVPSAVCLLPCKDLRQFFCLGGTAQLLENIMRGAAWK